MTKIKICGLKRAEDISIVNEYRPDYIGFVFAGTKRFITDEQAENLKHLLSPEIQSVGVFVNDDIKHIVKLANTNIIDVIQLHGDETNEYITTLRTYTDKEIIKAVRVKNEESIQNAMKYQTDYLLFDTYVKDSYGGTGKSFDRTLINKKMDKYFLAGGLGPENLKAVLMECNPFAVDLSSGVETDGIKDKEKIKEVIEIVKNYNYSKEES